MHSHDNVGTIQWIMLVPTNVFLVLGDCERCIVNMVCDTDCLNTKLCFMGRLCGVYCVPTLPILPYNAINYQRA